MTVFINTLATTLPPHRYDQQVLAEQMKDEVAKTATERRIIDMIYNRSGIKNRYSVLGDFKAGLTPELYVNGSAATRSTSDRNQIYEREARKLFLETGKKLLEKSGLDPSSITHLVTISCTGFYAPGPDTDLIREGLVHPRTERYHLGFMGCYAALSGLKLATRICSGDESATVMVIATELCSLHFQAGTSSDDLIATSLFADGSAGAILSNRPPEEHGYRVSGFQSTVTREGSDDMAWRIGDHGFQMTLSNYIPDLLSSEINGLLAPILETYGVTNRDIDHWAIHPGGRRILDKLEGELKLPTTALDDSREILSSFGNMSSVTILFLLDLLLRRTRSNPESNKALAMAFGPGLTVETALLETFSS